MGNGKNKVESRELFTCVLDMPSETRVSEENAQAGESSQTVEVKQVRFSSSPSNRDRLLDGSHAASQHFRNGFDLCNHFSEFFRLE
jgi:hypothetical protein